jgi:large subunit ribosomal protein L30
MAKATKKTEAKTITVEQIGSPIRRPTQFSVRRWSVWASTRCTANPHPGGYAFGSRHDRAVQHLVRVVDEK